jgi:hypothetical protein
MKQIEVTAMTKAVKATVLRLRITILQPQPLFQSRAANARKDSRSVAPLQGKPWRCGARFRNSARRAHTHGKARLPCLLTLDGWPVLPYRASIFILAEAAGPPIAPARVRVVPLNQAARNIFDALQKISTHFVGPERPPLVPELTVISEA